MMTGQVVYFRPSKYSPTSVGRVLNDKVVVDENGDEDTVNQIECLRTGKIYSDVKLMWRTLSEYQLLRNKKKIVLYGDSKVEWLAKIKAAQGAKNEG